MNVVVAEESSPCIGDLQVTLCRDSRRSFRCFPILKVCKKRIISSRTATLDKRMHFSSTISRMFLLFCTLGTIHATPPWTGVAQSTRYTFDSKVRKNSSTKDPWQLLEFLKHKLERDDNDAHIVALSSVQGNRSTLRLKRGHILLTKKLQRRSTSNSLLLKFRGGDADYGYDNDIDRHSDTFQRRKQQRRGEVGYAAFDGYANQGIAGNSRSNDFYRGRGDPDDIYRQEEEDNEGDRAYFYQNGYSPPPPHRRRVPKSSSTGIGVIPRVSPSILTQGDRRIGTFFAMGGTILTLLGISLFFNKTLLRLGNLCFIVGVPLFLGPGRMAGYFLQPKKARATGCLVAGVFLVLIGRPIFGMILEAFGIMNLFGNMFPVILAILRQMPVIGDLLGRGGRDRGGRRRANNSSELGRRKRDDDEYFYDGGSGATTTPGDDDVRRYY